MLLIIDDELELIGTPMSEREKLAKAEEDAIAQAIRKLNEYPTDRDASANRRFWEDVRSTSTLLQQSRNLSRDTTAFYRDSLSQICTVAKQVIEERNRKSEKNAARFDEAIKDAKALLNQDVVGQILSQPQFGTFFGQLAVIRKQLQDERELRKDDRNRLWQKTNEAYAFGKELQQRKSEQRKQQSESRLEQILSLVSDAELSMKWGDKREDDFRAADAKLREAFLWIKGDPNVLPVLGRNYHHDLIREHHQEAFERWKTAKDYLSEAWKELRSSNYREFLGMAEDALRLANNGQSREARSQVKETQAMMKGRSFEKSDYQDVRDTLERAYREARQVDLSRFLEMRDKKEELIDRIKNQISDLEDKASDARTESFADTVRGWISEKETFLQELQEQLESLEDKIRDMES